MLFVGIDIAKNKHDMAVIDSEGTIILKNLTFPNSKEGFDKCHTKLMELVSPHTSDISIAFEDTGHYGLNLLSFLRKYYLNLYSYNPLLIKKFAEAQTLRKTKTDKKDTLLIARKLLADGPELDQPVVPEAFMTELKFATRHRNRLTRSSSDAKIQYARILDMLFPELDKVINKHNRFIYTLLKKYPSVKAIARARITSLTRIKYLSLQNAEKIKQAALNSIGIESATLELELVLTIENIEYLEKQMLRVDEMIHDLMSKIYFPITSITGIGQRLGAVNLAEIRDINHFTSPAQLKAFAGLEPSINQSGESDKTGMMVKRGSPHLRWAIIQADKLVAVYSPTFKSYLAKKRSVGKHYNSAVSHVAKKLIRVIFYLLKYNKVFDERQLV